MTKTYPSIEGWLQRRGKAALEGRRRILSD
jgi:hypothetical protein